MRTISYRLQLNSDHGYVISNAKPDLAGGAPVGEVRAPGIKMTILDLPNKQDEDRDREEFLDQFTFYEDNWENPEFRECYRRMLCGERTNWKLVEVEVSYGLLRLDFVSETRFAEISKEAEHDIDSPYYNETVYFSPSESDNGGGLFQFEAQRSDGLIEIYRVSIDQTTTYVNERIGNQERFIRFDCKHTYDTGEDAWVDIEWYC